METKTEMSAQEIQAELAQCTGTGEYYTHFLGLRYTQGVRRMANLCKALWLVDAIAAVHTQRQFRFPFQLWELNVSENRGDLVMRQDCNSEIEYSQAIRYTDFPLAYIKLYVVEGVLMLPSEY